MNLCIDIGNTRVKWGKFHKSKLLESGFFAPEDLKSMLEKLLDSIAPDLKTVGVINVSKTDNKVLFELIPEANLLLINATTPIPLKNLYTTPATLGPDRIAAAIGAFSVVKKGPFVVFDAGSAFTWEVVNEKGEYLGGGIAPGIRMRLEALHHFTAKLPAIEFKQEIVPLTGFDTDSAMLSGAVNGLIGEIEYLMQAYGERYGDVLKTFITGGDAAFLGIHVKNVNFADPNLLLTGIETIIQYNRPDAQ